MTTITHLGVGEAFDPTQSNNSHLIEHANTTFLLDCGYQIPKQIWKYNQDSNLIDYIYISHLHADHYFGLSPLLMWMAEEQRTKPLTIFIGPDNTKQLTDILEYGYLGITKKLDFHLEIVELSEQKTFETETFLLEIAKTQHSVQNHALSIQIDGKKICYSGDGMYTKNSEKLYNQSDVLIHECYTLEKELSGHTNLKALLKMIKQIEIKDLVLTHLQRKEKLKIQKEITKALHKNLTNISIPEPLQQTKL